MDLTYDLNLYYKQIKRNLPCSSKKAELLIAPLKESISLYASTEDSVSINSIIETFGSPEEIAESYIDSLSKEEYKKGFCTKNRNRKIIVTMIIVILGAIAVLYISSFIYLKSSTPVSYEEYITEE